MRNACQQWRIPVYHQSQLFETTYCAGASAKPPGPPPVMTVAPAVSAPVEALMV